MKYTYFRSCGIYNTVAKITRAGQRPSPARFLIFPQIAKTCGPRTGVWAPPAVLPAPPLKRNYDVRSHFLQDDGALVLLSFAGHPAANEPFALFCARITGFV
jgi:hypothetical protein